MINQGLARLQRNITKIKPELTVNPEALLTVKVENLHAVSHAYMHAATLRQVWKHSPQISEKDDAVVRSLFHTLNIVLSCTLNTNPPSRFSKDDATKVTILSLADQDLMRNWAKSHGKYVRQRTVRQETTKYKPLPISFTQIFQTGNQIHQYSTRYSDFYRPHTCRTNIKKFSILFQGPRRWNSLPNDIKNAPSFSIFKRVIKPSLRARQNAT